MTEDSFVYADSPGSLRPSQIITTFGPGSIVQMANDSVLIMGLQSWPSDKHRYKILHHPFLEQILNKEEFRMPISVNKNRVIPCTSFPKWGVCSFCGRLQRHNNSPDANKQSFMCQICKKNQLHPALFIVMCDKGHIDDFPWIEWAHKKKNFIPCKPNPILRFYSSNTTQGLSDYKVKCMDCAESENVGDATSEGSLQKIISKCKGNSPWLDKHSENCDQVPRGIQTRSTSTYFSSVVSAIYIKKWLNAVQKTIDDNYDAIHALIRNNIELEIISGFDFFQEIISEPNSEWNQTNVMQEIKRRFTPVNKLNIKSTELKIRDEEYHDLIKTDDKFKSDELQITTVDISNDTIDNYLGSLKQINRITEIRVIRGFTRGEAPDPFSPESTTVNRCNISTTSQKWYPAVENKGEGIFFTLNENKLKNWESNPNVEKRCRSIINGFLQWAEDRNWNPQEIFRPRYLLLHTLAHMLIRELSISSGYNIASIRERIYRSSEYNGVIIYTASPSSDGSLGGLVKIGKKNHFKSLLSNTINHAKRCSRDPFCIDDDPQKKERVGAPPNTRLNGSACYACSLLPETSCENSNRLLDRKLIHDPKIGYFGDYPC